jgi:hypothetical protein
MYKDVSCAGKLPKIYLDVQNPQQVFSPNMIDVFIGNPTNHMLIFTGVAGPDWHADEDYGGGARGSSIDACTMKRGSVRGGAKVGGYC